MTFKHAVEKTTSHGVEFEEGEEYELSELPDSEMTKNGNLEMVGDDILAGRFGDKYVTFEFATVRVTDITGVDDL